MSSSAVLAAPRHRILDAGEEPLFVEGLLDEVVRAGLDGGDGHLDVTVPGDQDERDGAVAIG